MAASRPPAHEPRPAGAEVDFPPHIPEIGVIDRSDSSLTVSIDGSGGVETHYAVQRLDTTESGEWLHMEVPIGDSRFEDRGLNENSTYYYALRACNAVGCSRLSNQTGGVTEASGQVDPPATPSLNAETEVFELLFVWNTYINLSWETTDGATYYEIYRGEQVGLAVERPSHRLEFIRPPRHLSSQGMQQGRVLCILEYRRHKLACNYPTQPSHIKGRGLEAAKWAALDSSIPRNDGGARLRLESQMANHTHTWVQP